MRSSQDITALLNELEWRIADELEDQDLDFKRWDSKSRDKAVQKLVQMAVCMANGDGGSVVFGVVDRVKGRDQAILGVPSEIDVNLLKKAVYDQTDPHIMPVFEELRVPEGTGRLLVMQVYPGMPPYTDTRGTGTVRVGKDCQPLTGTLRRKIGVETGETDYTAEVVSASFEDTISSVAMETLRQMAKEQDAPGDLLRMDDRKLLEALGLLRKGKLTRAAILLCGNEASLREHFSGLYWLFLAMQSDIAYDNREDRVSPIPIAITRLEELSRAYNPISTVERGMYHFEYRDYPEIALREALMNAFCHADYRLHGPVMVKWYADKVEISNTGGFIAGIRPDNILHPAPAARNPCLVEALTRLRLVNRSNLGVARMFDAFLIEGKRPPLIHEIGESITVILRRSPLDTELRHRIAQLDDPPLTTDQLLVVHALRQQPLSHRGTLAQLTQLSERRVEELLDTLAGRRLAAASGTGADRLWRLADAFRQQLLAEHDRESQRETLLQLLSQGPSSISYLMETTGLNRSAVKRQLSELRELGWVRLKGKGPSARWQLIESESPAD